MAWTRLSSQNGSGGEVWERPLGDSEFAFHAFSHTGVGDMFLHLSFSAPPSLLDPERVLLAWSTLLLRHPLLLSRVIRHEGDALAEPCFSFAPPKNTDELLDAARKRLTFERYTKAEFVDRYMNGSPRPLDDDCIARLVIARSGSSTDGDSPFDVASASPSVPVVVSSTVTGELVTGLVNGHTNIYDADRSSAKASYDLYLCAPHFSGDALPLHQSAHDFLVLLSAPGNATDVLRSLEIDLQAIEGKWHDRLPLPAEALLPSPAQGRLARAAAQVNYLKSQEREVGGHTLPRKQHGPLRTVLLERGFSKEETKRVLQICKKRGVSANHAVFALVDVAWARMLQSGFELPIMNYTALSLRPYLTYPNAELEKHMSYWFVALTYFNIVLPAFLPKIVTCSQHERRSFENTFWERCRSVRDQIAYITQSKFLVHRARIMGAQRAERAGRKWSPVTGGTAVPVSSERALLPPSPDALGAISPRYEPVPSKALMGISLMGNLDKVYLADQYPEMELHDVATASRLKAGGLLFLAHTFAGRMWLHMAYDENGFEKGSMERFWTEVQKAAEQVLIDG
ncbi:hypothetical protein DACRYDRAFT_82912 [Dacryopinax primogenitus]|uniref:Condensation domain-containing protein n=1 Tax=Dacryopinax primogenitus (strain DJM 731) TaxID=1858805 RepID=M5FQ80_DACPD|nr:uncharacterized protein DACRYDRAFT_82912 [Dacryopinax primogenitus]EJT99015.1 hypothetical protein DACRYDRAFT_82912 [Dacryopinax primogenitus]